MYTHTCFFAGLGLIAAAGTLCAKDLRAILGNCCRLFATLAGVSDAVWLSRHSKVAI